MRGFLGRLSRLFEGGESPSVDSPEPAPDAASERRGTFEAPGAAAFLSDLDAEPVRPLGADAPDTQPRHPSLCARPDVSVVLGSLDRVELLKIAIESVREELKDLNGEIIVIDGGSRDGALEWLADQSDIITVVQHNRFDAGGKKMRRRSWGGFMNIAFRAAASENVLMISDDCRLLPGAVRAGLDRMEAARRAGLSVGGCAFYFRNWPGETRYYVQRTLGGNLMVNHGLYSKQALEAIGFANEDDYVFYKADTDLSLRLWRAGYAIIDSPDSICEHYVGIAEALRESNNAVMEYDREQMRRFWPELVDGETVRKMGKIELDREPGDAVEALWRPLRDAEQRSLDRANEEVPAPRARKPKTPRRGAAPKRAAAKNAAPAKSRRGGSATRAKAGEAAAAKSAKKASPTRSSAAARAGADTPRPDKASPPARAARKTGAPRPDAAGETPQKAGAAKRRTSGSGAPRSASGRAAKPKKT